MTSALIPRHVHVYDGRKSHEFANNREWQPPVRCSVERYASSGVSVLISFANVSIVSVNSPFLHIGKEKWLPDSSFMATTWQK